MNVLIVISPRNFGNRRRRCSLGQGRVCSNIFFTWSRWHMDRALQQEYKISKWTGKRGHPGRRTTCAQPLMSKIISEYSPLTSILSRRTSTLNIFFFMPIETSIYGLISTNTFSSICSIESLRILGALFWGKITGPLLYPVGNIFFTFGRKSV